MGSRRRLEARESASGVGGRYCVAMSAVSALDLFFRLLVSVSVDCGVEVESVFILDAEDEREVLNALSDAFPVTIAKSLSMMYFTLGDKWRRQSEQSSRTLAKHTVELEEMSGSVAYFQIEILTIFTHHLLSSQFRLINRLHRLGNHGGYCAERFAARRDLTLH